MPLDPAPSSDTRARRSDAARSTREGGAVLLLVALVLAVIMVVVIQMRLSALSDSMISRTSMNEFRYEFAVKGAFEQAKAALITDLRDEQLDAQSAAGGAEGGDGGGEGGGEGGNSTNFSEGSGGGGGAGGAAGEEQDPPNDALTDNWADPGQASQQYGDVEVRVRMIDEDRKFNLLSIVARDEDFREKSRERAIRLLDTFRETSRFDISYGDATDIIEEMTEWFHGKRSKDFPAPTPLIVAENPEKRFGDEEKRFADAEEEPIYYPLSFDELLMIENLDESVLHGFFEDDLYIPGLEDVATIYSNLAFDSAAFAQTQAKVDDGGLSGASGGGSSGLPTGGGGGSGSGGSSGTSGKGSGGSGGGFSAPFGSGEDGNDGSGGESSKGNEEEAQGPPTDAAGQLIATETNQGRININTAPLAVLRVIAPEDAIPYSVLEKIDEFRRTAFDEELLEQAKRRGYGSSGEGKSDQGKGSEKSSSGSNALADNEEDAEALKDDFTFHNPTEVFDKVQDYFDTNYELPEEARLDFQSALAVKSNVFTIYFEVRDRKAGASGSRGSPFDQTASRPDAIFRAIVWRRQEGQGFQAIPILPLHSWNGVLPPDDEDYRKKFPFGF